MLSPSAKQWTIMTYIAGADNMSDAARDALLQMKEIGSTKHFDLIVQFDTGSQGPTKRYHLRPISGSESEKNKRIAEIEKAREAVRALDRDSLGKLADSFSKLKNENSKEILKSFEGMEVAIGRKKTNLRSFLDTVLARPE